MKIIFLDIEGVLITINNGLNETIDNNKGHDEHTIFDAAAVRNLNRLIEVSDALIVVTSSWRLTSSVTELVTILEAGGVKNPPIIGVTPYVSDGEPRRSHRGKEILAWLTYNPSVTDYVVIDDCDYDNLTGIPRERIIRTTYRDGFGTEDAYRRAVEVLQ